MKYVILLCLILFPGCMFEPEWRQKAVEAESEMTKYKEEFKECSENNSDLSHLNFRMRTEYEKKESELTRKILHLQDILLKNNISW